MFSHISPHDRRAMVKTLGACALLGVVLFIASPGSDSLPQGSLLDNPPDATPLVVAAPVVAAPVVAAPVVATVSAVRPCFHKRYRQCPHPATYLVEPAEWMAEARPDYRSVFACDAHADAFFETFAPGSVYITLITDL